MRPQFALSLLAGAVWPLWLGCSAWPIPSPKQAFLPTPRMSPDSVVLEVAVLDIPADGTADEQLWREVDEQQVPPPVRRQLARCGLRCGVSGTQLPDWVNRRLKAQQKDVDFDSSDGAAVLANVPTQQRLQCRAGRKRTIPLGPPHQEVTAPSLTESSGAPRTWRDAQCELALIATPKGDGGATIELTPEIHSGKVRQRWVGEAGSFRLDASRDCDSLDNLRVSVTLTPGQTVVVSASPAPGGLGQAFFGGTNDKSDRRKVVLVRLAQTQTDDLFAPLPVAPPIASAGR